MLPSSTLRPRRRIVAVGRDPEMRSTKKGNQWYFGMKAHIGVDDSSPIVHSVHTTAANEHDVTQAHHLLHGEEKRVFADAGYQGVEKRPEHEGRDTRWVHSYETWNAPSVG